MTNWKKGARPLIYMKVYVDPTNRKTSPFFWFSYWNFIGQMRGRMKLLDATPANGEPEDAAGACLAWTTYQIAADGSEQLKPEMGEILMCKAHSGGSIIAHECGHAAFRYAERVAKYSLPDLETSEERHCLTVQFMYRQIVKRIIKLDEAKNARPTQRRVNAQGQKGAAPSGAPEGCQSQS